MPTCSSELNNDLTSSPRLFLRPLSSPRSRRPFACPPSSTVPFACLPESPSGPLPASRPNPSCRRKPKRPEPWRSPTTTFQSFSCFTPCCLILVNRNVPDLPIAPPQTISVFLSVIVCYPAANHGHTFVGARCASGAALFCRAGIFTGPEESESRHFTGDYRIGHLETDSARRRVPHDDHAADRSCLRDGTEAASS